jgi:Ran GTPase-activating protein (RanGAP) involved in mRNA processing and transport
LRGNNFAQVGAQAWEALVAQLPQLEELDLGLCRLRGLPIGLPASLKKLGLEGNNFAQVGAQAWAALSVQVPQLEELGLQGCGLRARPAGLPAHLIVRH